MADTTRVNIVITPRDCSWQSANELIEQIKQRNPNGYEISFTVRDCFKVDKGNGNGDFICQCQNAHAVGKTITNINY